MGNRSSRSASGTKNKARTMAEEQRQINNNNNDGNVYVLKKRRPGCTGLWWQQDPTSDFMLASGNHWPRDNALLMGVRVVDKWGDEWLRTAAVRNPGDATWHRAPLGSAIPMEHEDHYYLQVI